MGSTTAKYKYAKANGKVPFLANSCGETEDCASQSVAATGTMQHGRDDKSPSYLRLEQ
jgi:hypothetical protein